MKNQEAEKEIFKIELKPLELIYRSRFTDLINNNDFDFDFNNTLEIDTIKQEKIIESQFSKLKEVDQLNILYEYIKERSKNGIYIKESNRNLATSIQDLGYEVGKDYINKIFKKLVELEWLTENEVNKKYNLTKGDK